jgi:hypothetical protein
MVSTTAEDCVLGMLERLSSNRFTGGDSASAWPVTRMRTICMAKVSISQKPVYQYLKRSTSGVDVKRKANRNVTKVRTMANRKGSGMYRWTNLTKKLAILSSTPALHDEP